MELIQYIRLFRRWLWLILLAMFVGGGVSFIVSVNQPPSYRAEATVIVGSALESPNPNSTEIRTGIDLAVTYAEIVRTFDILEAVIQILELPFSPERLNSMISTRIVPGTSLLEVSVTNTDRILAAEIANEIVTQLILQSPSNLTSDQRANIDLLQAEIDAQTEELAVLRTALREVNQQISEGNLTQQQIEELNETRTTLTNQINDASSNIAQNLNTIASLTQRTNSVEIIEAARIPTELVDASLLSTVILGALVASSLAFGGVLLYEYMNDALRTADDVVRAINLPVLGVVSRFGNKDMSYRDRLLINLQSFSQTSEEYRTLRTNILYSTPKDERSFVISSASPREGKSVTAANLAASMALAGLRVLLIDADLRRPMLHETFGLPNNIGLSNLLTGRFPEDHVSPTEDTAPIVPFGQQDQSEHQGNEDGWMKVVQKTLTPNLRVITSGFIPNNPSELLGSVEMKNWMQEFQKSPHIDVIIFDTPPALAVSDSTILAASLQTKVVLIIQSNRTRHGVAIKAKERFENVSADIVGAVLNNANLREEDYYGYDYGYYYGAPGREAVRQADNVN